MNSASVVPSIQVEHMKRGVRQAANKVRASGLNSLDAIDHLAFLVLARSLCGAQGAAPEMQRVADRLPTDLLVSLEGSAAPARHAREIFATFRNELGQRDDALAWLVADWEFKLESDSLVLGLAAIVESISGKIDNIDVNGLVFEYLMKSMSESGHLGQYFTPRHIVDFMCDVLDLEEIEAPTVYDPAAGTAGFLVRAGAANPNAQLVGRELSATAGRLAVVNLLLHGLNTARLERGDSLAVRSRRSGAFDVIMTNPPFGGILAEDAERWHFPLSANSTEIYFLQHIVDALRPGGKAAIVCPEGLLSNLGTEKQLRKLLIDVGHIDAVFSLPGGTFNPYTGVRTGILVFEKARVDRPTFFFPVKSDGYSLDSKRHPVATSDLPSALDSYRSPDGGIGQLVELDTMVADDLRLVASRYVRTERAVGKHPWRQISELVELVRVGGSPGPDDLCIGLEHISQRTGRLAVPDGIVSAKSGKSRFEPGDILYGKLRPNLRKVAIAHVSGYCSTEVIVLRPRVDSVDARYIQGLMLTDQFTEVAVSLTTGANHPRIHPKDLLGISIPLPPRAEQAALADSWDEQRQQSEILAAQSISLQDAACQEAESWWD